jgi:gamma-glutamylcyclotransferase (GGCT)/AIG2-like uncharacterized protein YtfP
MDYFAFASNLNKKQMAERCPGCKPKFTATLPNYKLIFTGWSKEWKGGFASIKPFRGEKVAGAVYEISDINLKQLDRSQGYPAIYNRFNVVVWTDTGEPVEAFTYIKREQSDVTKPSTELLTYIRQGYMDWDIE